MPPPALTLDERNVQLTAFKRTEADNGYVIRLFEAAGRPRTVRLALPGRDIACAVAMGAFEVKTLLLEDGRGELTEADVRDWWRENDGGPHRTAAVAPAPTRGRGGGFRSGW